MKKEKTLSTLLQTIECTALKNVEPGQLAAIPVSHVTSDSRDVVEATLFVALEGVGVDGHNFIAHAIGCGATVVVGISGRLDRLAQEYPQVVFVEVANSYESYARIAANLFGHPGREMVLAAVTGTNGKTTVTYIAEDICKKVGKSVGVIGTVNNRYTNTSGETTFLPTGFTTPEAYSLQAVLREMADNGVDVVIMEVSSHALAQSRVGTLMFDVAAFTNLSRDHLDYHETMEGYFNAKKTLFASHLKKGSSAVLPQITEAMELSGHIKALHSQCQALEVPIVCWGRQTGADVQLLSYSSNLDSTTMKVSCMGEEWTQKSLLVGDYNVDNLLTAMALCSTLGIARKDIEAGVATTTGAPGRLQRITADGWISDGPTVFVDYAHTPDALEKVLMIAKKLPHRELIGVFGCGGDRDPGKRAVMGRIGASLCDVSIVTDDNPRTEDPDRIVAQVVEGAADSGTPILEPDWLRSRLPGDRGCVVIRNRKEAIHKSVKNAQKGDIVVVAGKGHEPYQLTIHGKKFFDDRLHVADALCSWTVTTLAAATEGETFGLDGEGFLGEVTTDSRTKTENGIFVALVGEHHDAHSYAPQAVDNGAKCVIVNHHINGLGAKVAQIVVADTLVALGDMAAYRRQRLAAQYDQKVIGLTGSCGKTTVKEMIAAILKRKYPEGENYTGAAVLKTEGNFNNLIGLPLSLLPIGVQQKVAVLEMGMNVPGEIARLTEIADPDICCITNIHGAHLLGLQSIEGVADAKEELFQGSKESATLIVNLDDNRIAEKAEKYQQKKITFGYQCCKKGVTPDLYATNINVLDGGVVLFTLHYKKESQDIHLYIAGEHNVLNALGAAATAVAAGCNLSEIARGLADFRAPDKRMELFTSKSGFQILNDTYNANPASMEAGLRALDAIGKARKIAVIGDMLELGEDAVKAHYEIGEIAAGLGLDLVITYGEWSGDVARGMRNGNAVKERVMVAESKEAIETYIKEQLRLELLDSEDLVLFKASRGLRFETIVECFR